METDDVVDLALLDRFEDAIAALDEPDETLDALIGREGLDPLLDAFDAEEVGPRSFAFWAAAEDGKLHQRDLDGGPSSRDAGSVQHGRRLVVAEEVNARDLFKAGYRTAEEVAELLGVSVQRVHALRRSGQLRAIFDSPKSMFMLDLVEAFVARRNGMVAA